MFKLLLLAALIFSEGFAYAQSDQVRMAAMFPELKVVQPTGLPVRVARENWEGARTLVARDPVWQKWVESQRTVLDRWMATVADRREWVGGDMHELLDPTTLTPLKWSVDLPMPVGTSESARKSREAWVAWLRNANFYRIQEAARLYRLTGDRKYAEWAASQLDFYANNYASWPLRDIAGQSRMMGQGLDEATAVVQLSDATRLILEFAGEARVRNWRDKLFFPIARQLAVSRHNDNIRLWHSGAETIIGLLFGDEALVKDGLDGPKGIRQLLKRGVTADFLWYEGSFGYQTYVLRALAPLFVQASLSGRASELYGEMLAAQNMMFALLPFRFDDGMLPTPGDSGARLKAIDLGLYLEMYRTLPNRISLIEAGRKRTWATLIDPVVLENSAATRLPAVQTRNFESIRMAVLKADGWQVFERYGQLVPHHAQQDALSTEIYFQDIPVSVSHGTVAYGSPLHTDYFHRAISHNTALVDGEGQVGFDPGVVDSFNADPPSLAASQPQFTPDSSAARKISIRDGELIDRLSITLNKTVTGNRRLGFLFHSDCQMISQAPPGLPASAPAGTGFGFWEKVTVRSGVKGWQGRIRCNQTEFEANFTLSGNGAIYAGKVPTKPLPAKRDALYFEIIAREAVLEMRIKPVR